MSKCIRDMFSRQLDQRGEGVNEKVGRWEFLIQANVQQAQIALLNQREGK